MVFVIGVNVFIHLCVFLSPFYVCILIVSSNLCDTTACRKKYSTKMFFRSFLSNPLEFQSEILSTNFAIVCAHNGIIIMYNNSISLMYVKVISNATYWL